MDERFQKFMKQMRVVFWAVFLAPVWVLAFFTLFQSEPTFIISSSYETLVNYGPPVFVAIVILISLMIRKNQFGTLYENTNRDDIENILKKSMIISCAVIEFAALFLLIGYRITGIENLVWYTIPAIGAMLLHRPVSDKYAAFFNHSNDI